MKTQFSDKINRKSDVLVFGVSDTLKLGQTAKGVDKAIGDLLTKAMKTRQFEGKSGQVVAVTLPSGVSAKQALIVGLGEDKIMDDNAALKIGGAIFPALESIKAKDVSIVVEGVKNAKHAAAYIAYGIKLKSYQFDKYFTQKKDVQKSTLKIVTVVVTGSVSVKTIYNKLVKVADGVYAARDVVSEPPNQLYPKSYAARIKRELTKLGVTVKILGEKQMTKMGFGALLGVGQGSIRESQLVVMEWRGNRRSKEFPVAFVGKGVTFDTGGISLKPSLGMEDMKYDMGGSAAVFGAMKALAGRKAKVNVVGVVGLVENMPGHNAQRPSDIVKSLSGQTVEVLNTDAEGRLVLGDALWYCQTEYKPKNVVDLATLTGAIVIALGDQYAGLFSNDDILSKQLTKAGEDTDEKIWRFPLGEAYDKMLDSPVADMQNISSGRGAGSITAAQYLQRFIKKGVNWAHLDIAGVAWTKTAQDVCPKGATGFGVRLLDRWVQSNFEKKE